MSRARARVVISEQRIKSKLAECGFFLKQMEGSSNIQEFAFYLSAFLAALSTFTHLGLRRNYGKGFGNALRQIRKSSSDLDLLLRFRDVEVHDGHGVRIWLYGTTSRFPVPRFRGSIWGDLLATARVPATRFESRFKPRYGDRTRLVLEKTAAVPAQGMNFVFEDSGGDVLVSCRLALDAVRSLA